MSKVIKAKPDIPAIVREYAEGKVSLRDLAKRNNVNHRTVYLWMLGAIGDEKYHALVTKCLANRVAEADFELDEAADAISIARAREKMRFSRMDLERRRPALYGQKQELTVQVAPILNISVADTPQIEPISSGSGTVIDNDTQQAIDK